MKKETLAEAAAAEAESTGAADKVYRGVMRELEQGRMVPGQRLAEPDLAARFDVGRNAVREALQRLAMRGVLDLSRHRSASIRLLDLAETLEILDVASVLTGLVARAAASRYSEDHVEPLATAMLEFGGRTAALQLNKFSHARRRFYRTLLQIGGNHELQRIFPAVGMHIIYSQYQSPDLQDIRLADYWAIHDAVRAKDSWAADRAGQNHVEHVRMIILSERG